MVPNTFCNGLCSGNFNQKCGSQEEKYHSIYYVGSYFDVLNGKEGGIICFISTYFEKTLAKNFLFAIDEVQMSYRIFLHGIDFSRRSKFLLYLISSRLSY